MCVPKCNLGTRNARLRLHRRFGPVLGLIIGNDKTGVDDAGDPSQQRKQKAQKEAQDAAGHQDRNGRKDDAEEVAKGFQILRSARARRADRRIDFLQSWSGFRFACLPQFFPGVGSFLRLIGLSRSGRGGRVGGTARNHESDEGQETTGKIARFHHDLIRVRHSLRSAFQVPHPSHPRNPWSRLPLLLDRGLRG